MLSQFLLIPQCLEFILRFSNISWQRVLSFCESLVFNSLAPGRPGCHFETAIFNINLLTGIFTSSKDNDLRWMPRELTDDKPTLVQAIAWCHQATSSYLSQCWPRFRSPYGITGPQWVINLQPESEYQRYHRVNINQVCILIHTIIVIN